MAVLRQELTRTTFQDRQIKLMTDIFTETGQIDKNISKGFLDLKNQVNTINGSIQGLYYSFVRYFETGTASFITHIEDAIDDLREGIDEDNRERDRNNENAHQRQADNYQRYINEQNKTLTDNIQNITRGITRILNIFGVSLDKVAQDANTLTDLVNIGVRNTGLSRESLKGFRDDIKSTVSAMNERTNDLYSPIQSIELMIGLINQTGIKNLKFYEEYAEMFIESQKTMNVNLGTLVEFSDTFYRKYNFSSSTMRDLMDNIRENTAGTSTSEEMLMQFMRSIDPQLYAYAYRIGGNTEQNYKNLSNNIQGTYTWLREEGYDADKLFNLVTGAATGGVTSNEYKTLSLLGLNPNANTLMTQLMKDPASLMINLINAIGSKKFATNYGGSGSYMASVYGIDYDTAVLAEAKGLNRSSYNAFMKRGAASDNPEDQIWISAEERTANKTEEIAISVEDMQEQLGIKFTTLFDILGVIKDAIVAVYGTKAATTLFKFFEKGLGSSGGFGALAKTGAIAAAIYFGAEAVIKSRNSSEVADQYIQQLSELGRGGYISVDSSGTATNTLSSSITETIQSGANASSKVSSDTLNQDMGTLLNVSGSASEWIMTNLGGLSKEEAQGKIVESRAPGRVDATRRNIALWNTAYKFAEGYNGREPDDTMLRMLEAYDSKGYLKDPRIYNWLVGIATNGNPFNSNMLSSVALTAFSNGKLAIPKWSNGILGIGAGYKFDSGEYDLINAYKQGTPFIPDDQVALLHEGEAVIPAEENPFSKYSPAINRQSYLKDIADSARVIENTGGDGAKQIINKLSEILTFIEFWKSDNESKDIVNGVLENARNMQIKLQLVGGSQG